MGYFHDGTALGQLNGTLSQPAKIAGGAPDKVTLAPGHPNPPPGVVTTAEEVNEFAALSDRGITVCIDNQYAPTGMFKGVSITPGPVVIDGAMLTGGLLSAKASSTITGRNCALGTPPDPVFPPLVITGDAALSGYCEFEGVDIEVTNPTVPAVTCAGLDIVSLDKGTWITRAAGAAPFIKIDAAALFAQVLMRLSRLFTGGAPPIVLDPGKAMTLTLRDQSDMQDDVLDGGAGSVVALNYSDDIDSATTQPFPTGQATLVASGGIILPTQINRSQQSITFGAGDPGAADALTRYLYVGYEDQLAKTFECQMTLGRVGTIQGIFVETAFGGPGTETVTMTVRKNGADTAMTVAYLDTVLSASETNPALWVPWSATDKLSIKCDRTGPTGALAQVIVTVLLGA